MNLTHPLTLRHYVEHDLGLKDAQASAAYDVLCQFANLPTAAADDDFNWDTPLTLAEYLALPENAEYIAETLGNMTVEELLYPDPDTYWFEKIEYPIEDTSDPDDYSGATRWA